MSGEKLSKASTNNPLDDKLADALGRKLGAAYSSVLEDSLPPDLLDLVKVIESKLAKKGA